MSESSQSPDPKLQQHLFTLYTKLKSEYCANSLDGYGLYLYGVVLKKLDLGKDALTVLVEAVHKEPMHWGGWMELEPLITDSTKVSTPKLYIRSIPFSTSLLLFLYMRYGGTCHQFYWLTGLL